MYNPGQYWKSCLKSVFFLPEVWSRNSGMIINQIIITSDNHFLSGTMCNPLNLSF